ncbi:MAG: YciI family protein [Saprospiraceae bacterium]
MRFVCCLIIIVFISCRSSVKDPSAVESSKSENITFDSLQAKSWGADEYGMKTYVLVFLKRGPNRSQDSTTRTELQAAHLANITRLANEGKLVLAGPMMTDEEIRGIYIFDVRTVKEAETLTETDPAVKAGTLIMEMHPWYGSASLKEIPKLHKRGAKIGF